MPESAPSRHATDLPSGARRVVVWAIAVVAAIHTTLVVLWVMPTNPIRDAIGNDRVEHYMDNRVIPFEQSWSVFAPTPRRADENVSVRAYLGETGTTTEWFDITADEDKRIRHLVNPSRIHVVTRRLGGTANELLAGFSDDQREIVTSDTPSRRGMTRGLPRDYVAVDDMLTRFVTMYAVARWGDGVTMVQVRIGHRLVPPFAKRQRVNLQDVPFTVQTLGWRKAKRGEAAAQVAFDGYVERARWKGSGS